MSPELSYEFLRVAKKFLKTFETVRSITSSGYRAGSSDVCARLPRDLITRLQLLSNEEGYQLLKARAVNEYWLLRLSCSVVALTSKFPFTPVDVKETLSSMRRAYHRQDLLERVVSASWDELLPGEHDIAVSEGLIVVDKSWPFIFDDESVNPVFSG